MKRRNALGVLTAALLPSFSQAQRKKRLPRVGYRRAAYFVHRIINGTKPADLPIEQASTFETIINLRTARALKLGIPRETLALADRVIE